VHVRTA